MDVNNRQRVVASGPSGSATPFRRARRTTYNLTAMGPGGKATSSANSEVNTKVDATLTANPAELHYRKIGDKVITDDNGTLPGRPRMRTPRRSIRSEKSI